LTVPLASYTLEAYNLSFGLSLSTSQPHNIFNHSQHANLNSTMDRLAFVLLLPVALRTIDIDGLFFIACLITNISIRMNPPHAQLVDFLTVSCFINLLANFIMRKPYLQCLTSVVMAWQARGLVFAPELIEQEVCSPAQSSLYDSKIHQIRFNHICRTKPGDFRLAVPATIAVVMTIFLARSSPMRAEGHFWLAIQAVLVCFVIGDALQHITVAIFPDVAATSAHVDVVQEPIEPTLKDPVVPDEA
jgi:hypothetical protein